MPTQTHTRAPDMYYSLGRAWRTHRWQSVMARMLERTETMPSGCMEWRGTIDGNGYGRVSINGTRAAHRVVAAASCGLRGFYLGSEPVHHKCANRACVNPAHLEPVTQVDNTIEMLARTYLTRRVRELEAALRLVDPANELITKPLL